MVSARDAFGEPVFDDPNLAFTRAHAVNPPQFRITFFSDKSTLVFLLSSTQFGVYGFKVYFAPISIASPAAISNPNTAYNVFQTASLIGSVAAPGIGAEARIQDTIHAGLDGWFFATAFNRNGIESTFTGPLRNPIVGGNDSRVPPDVLDQLATKADGGLDPWGRQLVEITVTATIPQQSQGISIITVADHGEGYTSAPTVTISGGGGTGASAFATVQNGAVAFITVTQQGQGFTTIPDVTMTGGGATRDATAIATLTSTGSFNGYQIYLLNYFSSGDLYEGPWITSGGYIPGQTLRGKFLLEQDTPPSHSVTLYFVALSQTGTRTDFPALAPSHVFATGIEP